MHLSPSPDLVAWHLGALHPVEQVLTIVLAFGPFVLLGVVIAIRRRQDAAYDETQAETRAENPADVEPQRER